MMFDIKITPIDDDVTELEFAQHPVQLTRKDVFDLIQALMRVFMEVDKHKDDWKN